MQNFGILGQLLKIPLLSAQKCHSAGGRGGPRFVVVDWNPNIFVTYANFRNPLTNFENTPLVRPKES